MIEAVPAGSLQVHLVTGALLVHGHDPAEAAITLAGDIGYVHATDAVAGHAGHGQAVPLGTGRLICHQFWRSLKSEGIEDG